MRITIVRGDICAAQVDAIVNPANSSGTMGGGVAAALKQAGGASIEQEATQHGHCPVGQAYLTTAGTLPVKAIIHAPTMEHSSEPIPPKQVELATMAALRAADEAGFSVIAVPGLGTGVGQVDPTLAAKIIYETVSMYLPDQQLSEVQLYAWDDAYEQALQLQHQHNHGNQN